MARTKSPNRGRRSPNRTRQTKPTALKPRAEKPAKEDGAPEKAAGYSPVTATGLTKLGLPVGGELARGDIYQPHSFAVGASCLLFGLPAAHSLLNGDPVSAAFAAATTLISLTADFGGNVQPAIFSASTIDRVCRCDRTVATAYALMLTSCAVYQISAWMVLCLVPLVAVLSYSRASSSRAVWIVRHCFWHVFAVAEGIVVMEAVYRSDVHGELRAMLVEGRAEARYLLAVPAAGALGCALFG
jgi:hypothetical protein